VVKYRQGDGGNYRRGGDGSDNRDSGYRVYGGVTSNTTAVSSIGGSSIGTGCTLTLSYQCQKLADQPLGGYKVKIIAGTGVNSNPNELLIASNSATTLTLTTNWTFAAAPDATTVYAIMDNWGVCVGNATSATSGMLTVAVNATNGTNYQVGDIILVSGAGAGGFLKVLTVEPAGRWVQ